MDEETFEALDRAGPYELEAVRKVLTTIRNEIKEEKSYALQGTEKHGDNYDHRAHAHDIDLGIVENYLELVEAKL